MSNEEKSIYKNKIILTIFILVFVFIMVAFVLLNSTANDTFQFHYIHNRNTGEAIGLVASILLYLLFSYLIMMIPFCVVFLFSLYLYFFLHRKDKRVWSRSYCPKYEDELHYAGSVSFAATYIAVLVLMALHITNIVTINGLT